MTQRRIKSTGVFTASDQTFQVNANGGGATTITIPDGDYYVLGDGSSDCILQEIEDQVLASTTYSDLTVSVDANGIVSFTIPSGDTFAMSWTGGGTDGADLRDWLRSADFTLAGATLTSEGSRTHKFGLYPDHVAMEDMRIRESVRFYTESDDGTAEVIYTASKVRQRVKINYEGGLRETVYKEVDQLEDWWSHAVQGKTFRWYPDTTVTAAYALQSEPFGWQAYKLLGPERLEHFPLSDGWYGEFTQDLLFALQS